mgnify:CR=1 FL=1
MTRFADREKARALRMHGKSYSEIKKILGIGKGTLSGWLNDMPLSAEQIRLLRDLNPRRIENYRETMRKKRQSRLEVAYLKARKDIGALSRRDLFIAGLYLYWGEGTKADRGAICMTNTDPAVAHAFLGWAKLMSIPEEKLQVRLHLYSDMDAESETRYWSRILGLSRKQFRRPYVKKSALSGLTYKNGYGHGTCNIRFENMTMWEYITMALKRMRELHARP